MRLSPWAPVALLCFSVPAFSQSVAKVKYVTAPAFVLRPGSLTQVKPGDALNVNDVLVTGSQGRARIILLDASEVTLAPSTEIRVVTHDPEKQQTLIEMLHGKVRTKVTPVTKQGGFFKVATPTAITYALGTIETIETAPVITIDQSQLEAVTRNFADLQNLQPNVNPPSATASPSPTSSSQPSDWFLDGITLDTVEELPANITPPLLNGNYNAFNLSGPWARNGFAVTRPSFLTQPAFPPDQQDYTQFNVFPNGINLRTPQAYSGPYSNFDSNGNDIWEAYRNLSRGPIPDAVWNGYGRSAKNNLIFPTSPANLMPSLPNQLPPRSFDWVMRNDLQSGGDAITSRYIFNRGNNFNLENNVTSGFSLNVPALSQGTLLNWTYNFTSHLPIGSQSFSQSSLCPVQNCRTDLLFPFITNQTGFDTGIANGANSAPQASSPTPDSVGSSFTPSAAQTQSFTLPAPDGSLSITINPVNNHPASGDPQVVPGSYYTFTRTFTDPSGTVTSSVTRSGTLPTFPGVTGTQDALKGVLYIGLSLPNPNPSAIVLPQFNSATQTFNALHPFTTPNAFNLSTLPYLQYVPPLGGLHLIPNVNALDSPEIYDETFNTITPIIGSTTNPQYDSTTNSFNALRPFASQLPAASLAHTPTPHADRIRLYWLDLKRGNWEFLNNSPSTAQGGGIQASGGFFSMPSVNSVPTETHVNRQDWNALVGNWDAFVSKRGQLGAFQTPAFNKFDLDFGSFNGGTYGNSFGRDDWTLRRRLTLDSGPAFSSYGQFQSSPIRLSIGTRFAPFTFESHYYKYRDLRSGLPYSYEFTDPTSPLEDGPVDFERLFSNGTPPISLFNSPTFLFGSDRKSVLGASYARYAGQLQSTSLNAPNLSPLTRYTPGFQKTYLNGKSSIGSKFRNLLVNEPVLRTGYSIAYDPVFDNIFLNISTSSPSAFQPLNLSEQHGLIGALSSRSIPTARVVTNTGAPPVSGANPFPTFSTLLDFKPGTANPDNKALSSLGITTKFTIWDGRGAAATRRGATYLNSGESVEIAADGTTSLPRMVLNASDFSGGNHVVNASSKSAEFNEAIKSLAQFEDCEPSIYINGVLVYGSGQIESEITGTGGSTPLAKIHIVNYGSCVVLYIITNSAVLVPSHIIGKAGGLLAGLALGAATGGSVIAIPSLKELQDAIAAGRLIIVFAKPKPKEPSKGGGWETAEEEPEPNDVTVPIRSFCLDLHKLAPHPKSAYKFADEGKQRELGVNGEIVNRVYRDVQSGAVKLPPGTSLDIGTQWTIWAIRQNLDAKKFTEEYLHIVEKNLEAQHKKLDKETKANMEERASQLFSFAQHFFPGAPKS